MLGELMEREIREQPEILSKGAEQYRQVLGPALRGRSFEMVLIAARGSSDNAALFGRYLIEVFLGIPAVLAAPSVLTRYHRKVRYSNCLAIGISQSGAAPDVAEVLASLREDGHTTLGITNTEGSRLTTESEVSLLLDAGEERSVAATKTYSASLLALYEVVRALGAGLPSPLGGLPTDDWMEATYQSASGRSGVIVRSQPSFSLGRGFNFSTAQEAALKLMECALIPCKAYSTADFEHGPKALAGYGSAVISFDGPMPKLAAQGTEVVECPLPSSVVPDPLKPLSQVIFGQWLALLCARARGLDPDHPQHIRKVTETL
jgi:glucosamine--fructose-6-phosphate aminotransferase (isomerizing)